MPVDPSRRPSNMRVRHAVDFHEMVWVECENCLGDGWHYPMATAFIDRAKKSRKITCEPCGGLGARRVRRIECRSGCRIVSQPSGHDHQDENKEY